MLYTDVASAVAPNETSTAKVPSTTTQAVTTSTNGSLTSTTPTTSTTTSSNGNDTYSDNEPKKENPNQSGMLQRSLYVVRYNLKLAAYNLYYQCYLIMQAYAPHAAKKPNEVSICRF